MNKFRVGVLGATGMVGQHFVQLLEDHPWFEITVVAASPQSAGQKYKNAIKDHWEMQTPIPQQVQELTVLAVEKDITEIVRRVDFVFCALDMDENHIKKIEERYAELDIPVISNNSAHRWSKDVPMIIPEVNSDHIRIIDIQKRNRNWKRGFIAVKPNCSIQSYVLALTALKMFGPIKIQVVSAQSISGAGKTFNSWPEMSDNVIPFIQGEEEKSEKEPLKIWGASKSGTFILAKKPKISVTCIRVPTSDGHLACVSVTFKEKPSKKQILQALEKFGPLSKLKLPSSPQKVIQYLTEDNRPQIKLDCNFGNGMGISVGRLREDVFFDWKFVTLSHNTIRGAAGGAILMAELLVKEEYIIQ